MYVDCPDAPPASDGHRRPPTRTGQLMGTAPRTGASHWETRARDGARVAPGPPASPGLRGRRAPLIRELRATRAAPRAGVGTAAAGAAGACARPVRCTHAYANRTPMPAKRRAIARVRACEVGRGAARICICTSKIAQAVIECAGAQNAMHDGGCSAAGVVRGGLPGAVRGGMPDVHAANVGGAPLRIAPPFTLQVLSERAAADDARSGAYQRE